MSCTELNTEHWHNGSQLSVLGSETATRIAPQPEECRVAIKFIVSFAEEVLRLSLCASLFLLIPSCDCG